MSLICRESGSIVFLFTALQIGNSFFDLCGNLSFFKAEGH